MLGISTHSENTAERSKAKQRKFIKMSGSDKKRRIVPTRAPKRKHSDEEEPIPEHVKIPKGETVADRRDFYKQVDAMVSLHSTFFHCS